MRREDWGRRADVERRVIELLHHDVQTGARTDEARNRNRALQWSRELEPEQSLSVGAGYSAKDIGGRWVRFRGSTRCRRDSCPSWLKTSRFAPPVLKSEHYR